MFGKRSNNGESGTGKKTGSGKESPQEAFAREKAEMRNGLNHWLRRCQTDEQYAHLEVNIQGFINRLSDIKTAEDVQILRSHFNAFVAQVEPGKKRTGTQQ